MTTVRCTSGAAAKVALPAWLAVSKQLPTDSTLTVDPETVQIEVEFDPNTTGLVEPPPVAVRLNVAPFA
jgi:hypothetical protein